MSAAPALTIAAEPFAAAADGRFLLETNGTLWRKRPRRDDLTASRALATEASVLAALGMWHHYNPDEPVLTTVTLGEPVTAVNAAFLKGATAQLRRHAKATAPAKLRPVESQVSRTWNTVLDQLGGDHPVTGLCRQILERLRHCPSNNRVIVNGDAHPLNWVLGDRDAPMLARWESAMLGPLEFDLATLAHALIVEGRSELLPLVEAPARNKAAFRWSMTVVAVAGLAEVTARAGAEAGERRRQMLDAVVPGFAG